jgi:hypothetical protein
VCGTVVTIDNPNELPEPGGTEPDVVLVEDEPESPYPCSSLAWHSGTLSLQETFPPSVVLDNFESTDEAFLFIEQCGMSLPADVDVDFSVLSPPVEQIFKYGFVCDFSPSTISAGTVVDVYLVHYDPMPDGLVTVELQFSRPILGLVINSASMDATDSLLGSPDTLYGPDNLRGLECYGAADTVILSADMKNLQMELYATGKFEQMRIIVAGE